MGELEKRFGGRLREARAARGLTQVELGERADLSEEWVRRLERGEGSPSFDKIEALAAALGVDPSEFFSPSPATGLETLSMRAAELSPVEVAWVYDVVDLPDGLPGTVHQVGRVGEVVALVRRLASRGY